MRSRASRISTCISSSSSGSASTGHQRTSSDSSLAAGRTPAGRARREPDVEVVDVAAGVAEADDVLVEVDRLGMEVEVGDARLLPCLTQRRGGEGGVARLEVAAEGEPATGLAVQVEQHLVTGGRQHQRAGGQVVGEAGPPLAVGVRLEVRDVARPQCLLVGRRRDPATQRRERVGVRRLTPRSASSEPT